MKEQIDAAIEHIKGMDIKGCLTGSTLLGYFPDEKNIQDIDIFLYNEKAFTEMYFALYHSPLFQLLEPLEIWKSNQFREKESFSNKHKSGVQSIKFMFNTCIPVNIIFKKDCNNVFSTLASFDIDIICKGYCLQTKQYLDLTGNSVSTKIANVNKWNTTFCSNEIWSINNLLRQISRIFKYHNRNFNMDGVMHSYIELIDKIQNFQNIFSSEGFDERLKISKENTLLVKKICETWLETHEITEEELTLLDTKLKEI